MNQTYGAEVRWWRRHLRLLLGVAAGYVLLAIALVALDKFETQWADVTTAYFVLANLLVLWWYADLTRTLSESARRQATSAEHQIGATQEQLRVAAGQLDAAREQLALMGQEIQDSRLARLQDQKPVVFVDRVENAQDPRNFNYVARNVGGGVAVNVYYFDVTITTPVSLGALAAGAERTMPAETNRTLCDGGAGIRCLLVAEAPFTRTTQWTPTLNLRTQEAGAHKGQVLHRTAIVGAAPARFEHQGLSDYMTANHQELRDQLTALDEQDYLGPRLLERGRGAPRPGNS